MSKEQETGKRKKAAAPQAKPRAKAAPRTKKKPQTPPVMDKLLSDKEQKPCTELEERFLLEYMIDLNGTQAYIRANPGAKTASATVMACRWLGKVHVQRRLAELRTAQAERLQLDSDEIVRGVLAAAHADRRELSEYLWLCCRYCHGVDHKYQRTAGELEGDREQHEREEDRREASAFAKNKAYERREFSEKGGAGFNRWADPHPDCPECMGRGMGQNVIKDTRSLSPSAVAIFAGIEETKDGIKVVSEGRAPAQDKLFRHLGLYEADNVQKSTVPEKSPEEWAALYAAAQDDALKARDAMKARRAQIELIDEQERLGTAGGRPAPGDGAGAAA